MLRGQYRHVEHSSSSSSSSSNVHDERLNGRSVE